MKHRLLPLALTGLLALAVACDDSSGPGVPTTERIRDLQSSQGTSCALLVDGTLWCWGQGFGGGYDTVPTRQPVPDSVTAFALGTQSWCAATAPARIYCWGLWYPVDGAESYGPAPSVITDTLPLVQLAAAMGHVCGVRPDSSLACWGSTIFGKRGFGAPVATVGTLDPNLVQGTTGYRQVVTGNQHSCGLLTSAGQVTCWGAGAVLGDTAATMQSSDTACFFPISCALAPIPVTSLNGIEELGAGSEATCARGTSVWCWGYLGTYYARPTTVVLPEPAHHLTVGNGFACALSVLGRAYCWGAPGPALGRPGSGTAPAPVMTSLRFRLLAAGSAHTCGVTVDDAVYCWGDPVWGPLSPTFTTPTPVPQLIAGPW